MSATPLDRPRTMRTPRIRRAAALVLLVALGVCFARAAEPPTIEEVVDRVSAAHDAGEATAIEALAQGGGTEVWLVADELLHRERPAAALAFARAAGTRKEAAELAAYVEARGARDTDAASRADLDAALAAAQAGRWAQALEVAGRIEGALDTVVRLRAAFVRGLALDALGRRAEGVPVLTAVGEAGARLGWLAFASNALHAAGASAYRTSDWGGALAAWTARLGVARRLEDDAAVARTLGNLGNVHLNAARFEQARAHYVEAIALKRKLQDARGVAISLGALGVVERSLGNYPQAQAHYEEALRLAREFGSRAFEAQMLGNLGNVCFLRGEYPAALQRHEAALAILSEEGDRVGVALALKSLGDVRYVLGDYEGALARRREALERFRALGDRQHAARLEGSVGSALAALGSYAQALAHYESALAQARAVGDPVGAGAWLAALGVLQGRLGNHERAFAHFDEARTTARKLGARPDEALALANLAGAHADLGRVTQARTCYEQALALRRELGDRPGVAQTLLALGTLLANQGEHEAALARLREALALCEAMGERPGVARAHVAIGFVQRARGAPAEAAASYEEALRVLGAIGEPADRAHALAGLAAVRQQQARPAEALALAREGTVLALQLGQGLGEAEGAGAREAFVALFEVGMEAALAAGDVRAQVWFLEHGRATSLREALGAREALQSAVVPRALAEALTLARLGEQRARAERLAALARSDATEHGRTQRALLTAQDRVQDAVARIQREAKAAASLVLPSPDDLDTIRARLRADEALLAYGLTPRRALAVVVRRSGARMVDLGPAAAVHAAVDALLHEVPTHLDPARIDAVRARVVAPLGLGPDVRRVLVSPVGRLGYVPFALLLPDAEIGYAPSGTALGLLLAESAPRGAQVLAVGDPDYRRPLRAEVRAVHDAATATHLAPLPATRAEAEAVGDVVLLGEAATPAGLRAGLGTAARWRALHLACHARVDPQRPLLSALALTPDPDGDGFLTCLDVLRMRVPADLVVLSACETGRGRLYATEGIVGLTRAFMFAGAPRVLCSLWKVDDAATQALMVEFYARWSPTAEGAAWPDAAAALRAAQEHVRTLEREVVDVEASRRAGRTVLKRVRPWADPAYWAAWVLWGRPD